MPEGLSPSEVGKEIAEHHKKAEEEKEEGSAAEAKGRDRVITIIEALLLAIVAVLAAYSGFAAAKWGTDSSLQLAKASAARTEANRVELEGFQLKNFDSLTFNAWFTAYVAGNKQAMQVAEYRFRPNFLVAFNAWLKTHPFTNPHAPKGPTYMPEYIQPELAQAAGSTPSPTAHYAAGERRAAIPTATSGPRSIWRPCCSWWASAATSGSARRAWGSSASAGVILVFASVLLLLAPKPPV